MSLRELCQVQPLKQGLSELVAYLELGNEDGSDGRFTMLIDEQVKDIINWTGEDKKSAALECLAYFIYAQPVKLDINTTINKNKPRLSIDHAHRK